MQQRPLGRTGERVSALGFGCMGLSSGYGPPVDRDAGVAVIRAAADAGVTFFEHLNTKIEYERMEIDELDESYVLWFTGAWRF